MKRFKINDRVHYTNGNGVYIGIKTITGTEYEKRDTKRILRYFITPTDTPWFSHSGEGFRKIKHKEDINE